MRRSKEFAKFACGAEAFHALIHAYFWVSGTTVSVLGIRESPKWHQRAAIGNAVVSLVFGLYAWSDRGTDPAEGPPEGEDAATLKG